MTKWRLQNLQSSIFLLLIAWKKYIEKPRAWFSFEILFYKNVWFSIILWKLEVFMGILNKNKVKMYNSCNSIFEENYLILLSQLSLWHSP